MSVATLSEWIDSDQLLAIDNRKTCTATDHADGFGKRDATYLSAMRNRSRWDVARDFRHRFSLLVAIAALVFNIRR
ncbi:hypothetical protein [Amycolatopsis sp. WGS_07]|uniref:hypothetical protein n=1 Tax=Amycolatopsis sp. WGS_07 TaxID=3076764 RepID=UPI00387359AE